MEQLWKFFFPKSEIEIIVRDEYIENMEGFQKEKEKLIAARK
jgi:hypothetical protein